MDSGFRRNDEVEKLRVILSLKRVEGGFAGGQAAGIAIEIQQAGKARKGRSRDDNFFYYHAGLLPHLTNTGFQRNDKLVK
jgi:hypothetical protein